MYTNAITSTLLGPARLPLIMPNERDAISLAARLCHRVALRDAKIVRIKSTLHLNEIWASRAYEPVLKELKNVRRVSEYQPMQFDGNGKLI